jgi:hypothetical protein
MPAHTYNIPLFIDEINSGRIKIEKSLLLPNVVKNYEHRQMIESVAKGQTHPSCLYQILKIK